MPHGVGSLGSRVWSVGKLLRRKGPRQERSVCFRDPGLVEVLGGDNERVLNFVDCTID